MKRRSFLQALAGLGAALVGGKVIADEVKPEMPVDYMHDPTEWYLERPGEPPKMVMQGSKYHYIMYDEPGMTFDQRYGVDTGCFPE